MRATALWWGEIVSADDEHGLRAEYSSVSPDYLVAMGIEQLAGRSFNRSDTADAPPVVIIDQALQRRLWPGEEAVGNRLSMRGPTGPFIEIIGVVETTKQRSLVESPQPAIFRPMSQSYSPAASAVLKTASAPDSVLLAARGTIRRANPDVPIFNVRTIREFMTYSLWAFRIGATLATVFGALALVLTACGLYGLISYTVALRTSEIGIRMALGAASTDVRSMVIRQGGLLVSIGGAIGLVVALFLPGLMSAALVGVDGSDPLILTGVTLTIAGVSLGACYLPARRASRIDPMQALRTE